MKNKSSLFHNQTNIFDINKNELSRKYNFLNNVRIGEIIPHDNINSINYVIYSNRKKYVLRNFLEGSSIEKIEKTCKILEYCYNEGVNVPQVFRNKNKKFVNNRDRTYLTKFYKGNTFSDNRHELCDLAKNIALLHKSLKDNPFTYNYNYNRSLYKPLELKEFNKILQQARLNKNSSNFNKKITKNSKLIKKIISIIHNSNQIDKLCPLQLIHFDLHPGNILFKNNKVQVILDFHTIKKGLRIGDIAFCSFRFSNPENINIKSIVLKMISFLKTYDRFNKIQAIELQLFDRVLLYELFLRLSFNIKKYYYKSEYNRPNEIEKFLLLLKSFFQIRDSLMNQINTIL